MKKYSLFICYCFALNFIETTAQNISSLKVSDNVPDVSIGKELGNSSQNISFSDFKGKLIILDFWNVRCSACISTMPKMDSLQKRYENKIKIIYVTKDSANEVKRLFSRIKIKKPDVPFITDDSILNLYFPHMGDPFHVWIGEDGKVYALTFDYSTNSSTINDYLNGLQPQLLRRWDYGINENYSLVSEQNAPLLNLANSYSVFFNSLIEYSSLTPVRVEKDSFTNKPLLLSVVNAPLNMLYSIAFNNDLYGTEVNYFNLQKNNRIIYNTKDSARFFYPSDPSVLSDWTLHYTYGYEIKVGTANEDLMYPRMQEDLNRYLPFKATIENRKTKCLVLTKNEGNEKLQLAPSCNHPLITHNGDGSVSVENMSPKLFVVNLIYENPDLMIPVIDDTGLSSCLNMRVNSGLSDLKALNNELQKYGLSLREEERNINFLIVSDKNTR